MTNLMAGSLNGQFPMLGTNRLEVVSLLINNNCNLACKHCYLETERFEKYLTIEEWLIFYQSIFSKLKPSILCFSGKEVFLNNQSVSNLTSAVKKRNDLQGDNPETQIGVITNGTLIHNHKDKLTSAETPDYIDVSIDGLPEQHDYVRGKGAFQMLSPNLRWLSEEFPNPVWITHTLLENNINSLSDFIKFYSSEFNIANYSIGLYRPLAYTDASLKISHKNYYELAQKILPSLEEIQLKTPAKIHMEFDITQLDIIDILAENGWANPADEISTITHQFDNGLTLQISTTRIPTGLWRAVRVTPEGYWLAAEDLTKVREYPLRKVASLREFNFDAERLYHQGLKKLSTIPARQKVDELENLEI